MKRRPRRLLRLLVLAALAAPGVTAGQTPRAVTIGVLLSAAAPPPGQSSPWLDAFRGGLRDLGYVEGRDVVLEIRWSEGREQRLAEHAADLVRLEVAVIVSGGTPAALAARTATRTIPIVMASVGDPIGSGMVASLARPGANVTGLSLLDSELDGKRIELLREAVPNLTRLGVLWSANDPGMTLAFSRVEAAARALSLTLQNLAVREPTELPGAFQAARAARVEALIVTVQPFTNRHRSQILDLVAAQRLPAMFTLRTFVDAGGLMAYGPSQADLYRRAATYVDRILKGSRPADLPVEQPTKFELVINLRTARALRLAIPASLLARADQVIE